MKLTEEHLNHLRNDYLYYNDHKDDAEAYFGVKWINLQNILKKEFDLSPMKINKKCASFLGCHVAERVLSHVFKDVEKMPYGNIGFDFICNKGFKIDVKASCLHVNNSYAFHINRNKIADYFLLVGFDNRENLNPQHIWLMKSNIIIKYNGRFNKHIKQNEINRKLNEFEALRIVNISNSLYSYDLSIFSKYELIDKLKETIECCTELKIHLK